MTDESEEREFKDILDEVLPKLTNNNFISMFFLLLENFISVDEYVEVLGKNRNEKETFLKQILLHTYSSKELLIELFMTIKRYDLLQALDTCCHAVPSSLLHVIWKSLYEACEEFEKERDWKYFKKAFDKVPISEEDESSLDTFIVEAYKNGLISEAVLISLLKDLNECNQISKTWIKCSESYLAKPRIKKSPDRSVITEENDQRPKRSSDNLLYIDYYSLKTPTKESPCGLVIIVNNENFEGEVNGEKLKTRVDSPLDVEALKKLWLSFGFEIRTYPDCSKKDILHIFQELSNEDLSCYDVFVSCCMSHGNQGTFYSSDSQEVPIGHLIDFMANKCQSLKNKPKLFFIQACQGSQIQCDNSLPIMSLPVEDKSNISEYPNVTPLFADVFVAISSIPGFVSFASQGKNSWFIGALVQNMEEFGDKLSILDVLVKVNDQVCDKKGLANIEGCPILNCRQTVVQLNTLRKVLKLKKLQKEKCL